MESNPEDFNKIFFLDRANSILRRVSMIEAYMKSIYAFISKFNRNYYSDKPERYSVDCAESERDLPVIKDAISELEAIIVDLKRLDIKDQEIDEKLKLLKYSLEKWSGWYELASGAFQKISQKEFKPDEE